MNIKNLYNIRKQKGYTQKELAFGIGVSESLISYWESGKRVPSLKTLENLVNFLDIDINELFHINMQS